MGRLVHENQKWSLTPPFTTFFKDGPITIKVYRTYTMPAIIKFCIKVPCQQTSP